MKREIMNSLNITKSKRTIFEKDHYSFMPNVKSLYVTKQKKQKAIMK